MCYGSLDPKYHLRDIEARLKTVAIPRDTQEKTDTVPKAGLLAPIWLALAGWTRKDLRKA